MPQRPLTFSEPPNGRPRPSHDKRRLLTTARDTDRVDRTGRPTVESDTDA